MKNIGKYYGIPCYECTHNEYVSGYNSNLDNGKQIFIINGIMVRNNKIIGQYDGQHVKDLYGGRVYFVATATKDNDDVMDFNKRFAAEECEFKSESETAIDFGKYSTVVDEFFALLEV